jgi:hypothetical protein
MIIYSRDQRTKPSFNVSDMLFHRQDQHGTAIGFSFQKVQALSDADDQPVNQGTLTGLHVGDQEVKGASGDEPK